MGAYRASQRIIGVMATQWHRNWTAQIVIASEHAGLAPLFKALEVEMYRVLARVDDPSDVRGYLKAMVKESGVWFDSYEARSSRR